MIRRLKKEGLNNLLSVLFFTDKIEIITNTTKRSKPIQVYRLGAKSEKSDRGVKLLY
ncbi:hypothetical protein SacRon12I_09425 [Sulfolobus acidocaldarius Ron12/I]|uniref:Uncharacterized protein n=1 Tax=Sulfolobus acidocaldarius Ron12/I TaxID=1028567 RepID=M1J0H3_9CREN|nr:hypothetical protein SacRon12I_09425 [Sulfolobus acidocaldarius Ron12/I]